MSRRRNSSQENPDLSFLNKQELGVRRINLNTRRDAFLRGAVWEPLHNPEAASFPTLRRAIRKKMWHLPLLLASYEPRELRLLPARSLGRSCHNCNLLFHHPPDSRARFPFLIPSFHPLRTDADCRGHRLFLLLRHVSSLEQPYRCLGDVPPHKPRICRSP